ncbi:unnamed protein product [Blepharisma stoltei]|uniref:Uncharacterized protein n=1 Tax=Blepharisma stoltei TaxID=1481888 RepID=A0AAU9IKF7_9CILI|nr:unnamed protein product [Blepharisma stoltei]
MARHFKPQSLDLYSKIGAPTKLTIESVRHKPNSAESSFPLNSPKTATMPSNFFITETHHKRTLSAISAPRRSLSPHVQSPISFEKQLARPEFLKWAQDVHHNRFIPFDHSPPISTKVQNIRTPDMSKYLGRETFKTYQDLSSQASYDPNYSAVKKNTEKGTIKFNKAQGRPPFHRITKSDIIIDSINYSQIDSKTQSPDLSKSPTKPCDKTLPAFMLSGTDRNALKHISLKTLEMNSYMKSDLLPLSSTFGEGWTSSPCKTASPIRGRCPQIIKILTHRLKHPDKIL